jgi:hypothetical protein
MCIGSGIGARITDTAAMIANGNRSPYVIPWVITVWVIVRPGVSVVR